MEMSTPPEQRNRILFTGNLLAISNERRKEREPSQAEPAMAPTEARLLLSMLIIVANARRVKRPPA